MARETSGKREREKKKQRKKQDKADKREMRRADNDKGKSFEDMLMYLDENGNLSSTPPDPRRKKEIMAQNIQVSVPKQEDLPEEDTVRNGVVRNFDTSKGYGFIRDNISGESIFVHANNLSAPVKEGDKVTFEIEQTHKGSSAVNVKPAV